MTFSASDIVRQIGSEVLDAVRGDRLVEALSLDLKDQKFWVAGVGKASVAMARGLERRFPNQVLGGLVITKEGDPTRLDRCQVLEAPHPVPGPGSLRAGEAMLAFASDRRESDLVLFCLSGGASAMMESLESGISLEDLQATNRALLASGATIHVLNAFRRRLSRLKAGGLARAFNPAKVHCLVLSDVEGDDPRVIGSGPLMVAHYAIDLDPELIAKLPIAVQGKLTQQVPDLPPIEPIPHTLIGNRETAYDAAAESARASGYEVRRFKTPITGEARELGEALAAELLAGPPGTCWIGVGEPTVTLKTPGKGGRCQELACAAANVLRGHESVALAALGTDGTDGPTDAAGAWCDGTTWADAEAAGFPGDHALEVHQSYAFHEAAGTLWRTGPTGSNVNDLFVGVRT